MSEERLQEIKDSIEFQYTLAKAKGYDNALLFTNEEEELVEEIERLNNIINEIKKENKQLKGKIKKLSQWDINKDTKNSRQRVANAKLLKENRQLKKRLTTYQILHRDCKVDNLKNISKIEEDKKIEKLTIGKDDVAWCEGNMKTDEEMVDIVLEIKDKINEIIDYIMEEK